MESNEDPNINLPMNSCFVLFFFLIKKPEIRTGKKTASSTDGADQTGCLPIEESK